MNELCNLKPDVTVRATITGNTLGYGSLLKKNENGTYSMMFQLSDDEICYPGYLLPDDIDFNNLQIDGVLLNNNQIMISGISDTKYLKPNIPAGTYNYGKLTIYE